jgi:hypothetical protein
LFTLKSGGRPYTTNILKNKITAMRWSLHLNMGLNIGFHFDILDIGGGFPGDEKLNLKFEDVR